MAPVTMDRMRRGVTTKMGGSRKRAYNPLAAPPQAVHPTQVGALSPITETTTSLPNYRPLNPNATAHVLHLFFAARGI